VLYKEENRRKNIVSRWNCLCDCLLRKLWEQFWTVWN